MGQTARWDLDSEIDGVAATVVLLRERDAGLEVLLLERPDRGSFAGAWVFPGGALEQVDVVGDDLTPDEPEAEERAARRAGARETLEETALAVDPGALVHFSRWYPPVGAPKRYRTWFYATRAPAGEPVVAESEAVAFRWLRPADALALHERGELTLFPPTWVTLLDFAGDASADAALERCAASPPRVYAGRFGEDRRHLYWSEDVAFDDESASEHPGPRHRLDMSARPWMYERSF